MSDKLRCKRENFLRAGSVNILVTNVKNKIILLTNYTRENSIFTDRHWKIIVIPFIMMNLAILCGIIFSDQLDYIYKVELPISSYYVGIFAAVALCIVCFMCRKCEFVRSFSIYKISFIVFLVQIYILLQTYHIISADTEVIVNCASWVWDKPDQWYESLGWFGSYFSAYYNNYFVMILCSYLVKLETMAGIIDTSTHYVFIIMVQGMLSLIGGIVLYKFMDKKVHNINISVIFWSIYVMLICFSQWIAVPYTHQFAVFISTSILYLYDRYKESNQIKFLTGMGALIGIGYKLTPISIIVGIAICIYELLSLFADRNRIRHRIKNMLVVLIMSVITMGAIGQYEKYWSQKNDIPVKPELQFGIAHYLNMGINGEGIYDGADVEYSYTFQSKKEQNKENLRIFQERMNNMTVFEMAVHYIKKLFTTTGDGTFGYKGVRVTVSDVTEKNESMTGVLRDILRTEGRYNIWYILFVQILWCMVFLGTFVNSIIHFRDICSIEIIIMLSVLGTVLYDMLFESNCHHMFSNVSLIILLSGFGVHHLIAFFKQLKAEHNKSILQKEGLH